MKNLISILALLFTVTGAFAQAPEKMSYQAVIRSNTNQLIVNQQVGVQISILKGNTPVYVETHSATTNDNGLVSVEIGNGAVVSGTFAAIDWANGSYNIKTETDPAGGTNYTISGTSKLLSVPYALYAANGGTPGPQGTQGPAGPQGIQGDAGPKGDKGNQGVQGVPGTTGPAGSSVEIQGSVANAVALPAVGNTKGDGYLTQDNGHLWVWNGSSWVDAGLIQGPAGSKGDKGDKGDDGPTGSIGPKGNQGIQGIQGLTGATGPKGDKGDQGDQGLTGPAGAKGNTGATGVTGPKGDTGATGPKGDNGLLLNGTVAGNTPYWNGSSWIVNSGNIFNNGGNIGIGTTTPVAKLHVEGSVHVNSSFGNFRIGVPNATGWQLSTVGGGANLQLYDVTAGTANSVRMYVQGSTGNFGIGTTSPLSRLDVRIADTGMVANFYATGKLRVGFYEGINYRGYVGSSAGSDADVDLGSNTGSVHLVTGGTIDLTASGGNIGIGTTTPTANLEVNRNGTGQTLKLNATDQVFLGFWENNGYRGYVGSYYGDIADVDIGSFAGSVHLVTGSTIDLTADAGKIGIGTTTPQQLLHVHGSSTSFIKVTSGSAGDMAGIDLVRTGGVRQWRIANTGSTIPNIATGSLLLMYQNNDITNSPASVFEFNIGWFYPTADNSTTLGSSNHRWSTVYAGNGVINTSDAREKSNITDLNYGLSEIMKLRPVSFTWTERPQWGTKLGLIAQEVKEVVNEVVVHGNVESKTDETGNPLPQVDKYGIYYSDLIPVLIKAVQDQQKIIEELNTRIENLESK